MIGIFDGGRVLPSPKLGGQYRCSASHAHAEDEEDVDKFVSQRRAGQLHLAVRAQHDGIHDVDADGDHILQHDRPGQHQRRFIKGFVFDEESVHRNCLFRIRKFQKKTHFGIITPLVKIVNPSPLGKPFFPHFKFFMFPLLRNAFAIKKEIYFFCKKVLTNSDRYAIISLAVVSSATTGA